MTRNDLKAIRKATGLTQKVFAKRLGVSIKLVQSMEAGTRNITPRTARDIMHLVQVTDDKKGISADSWQCPFCNAPLEVKSLKGVGSKVFHRCQVGVTINSRHMPKDMLRRALTPFPKYLIKQGD